MKKLVVIKYTGNHNTVVNLPNHLKSFESNAGIEPEIFLEENTKEEIFDYLEELDCLNSNLIIHINAHGNSQGICKELLNGNELNIGDLPSLILWKDLINLFNKIAGFCSKLTVNLGAVCNSHTILDLKLDLNFDVLLSIKSVSDTIKPMKKTS